MRRIPLKIRSEIAKEATGRCIVENGQFGLCGGRIQWHHPFIYAEKQIVDKWATVELCAHHHRMLDGYRSLKLVAELNALAKATDEDLAKYPRRKWHLIHNQIAFLEAAGINPYPKYQQEYKTEFY